MTPKERRNRLFKPHRPHIRPLQIFDGPKYHKDIGYLWVSHKKKPFYVIDPNVTEAEFGKKIEELSTRCEMVIIEDENPHLKKRGPIAMVGFTFDGWRMEPHAEFMHWATAKNKLRGTVAFLQMMRFRKIGVCVIHALLNSKLLLDKCITYGVLQYVGRIPRGTSRGDEHIYYVNGRSN